MPQKKRSRDNIGEWVKFINPEQIKFIEDNYELYSVNQFASMFGVKPGTIRSMLTRYKIKKKVNPNVSYLNMRYAGYKSTAKKRGLVFELNKVQFRKLTSGNCIYCKSPPEIKTQCQSRILTSTDDVCEVLFNGIDRQDNSIGYVWENCVSCCELCNKMKLTLGLDEFKEHISKIYKNLVSLKDEE